MLDVKKEGIVLEKTTIPFENEGVLNPAVIKDGNLIHMFYRAVRQGNFSTIGYCNFSSPMIINHRNTEPIISAEMSYELQGVEDPRIVKIDDTFYLSYTAYDGMNALGALAISTDMIHWQKLGIVVPQITYDEFNIIAKTKNEINEIYLRYNKHEGTVVTEGIKLMWDKNLILFPRKINGKFLFLHRIKPDIQIVVAIYNFKELTKYFWHSYFTKLDEHIVLSPKYEHEVSYVGGGCPPIETPDGWLLIYHGVYDSIKGYVYCACAALLDLENPQIELSRLPYPLFKPELKWELKGEVNNVCFPTGAIVIDDTLYIYYGAADERIACASISLSNLINELIIHKI